MAEALADISTDLLLETAAIIYEEIDEMAEIAVDSYIEQMNRQGRKGIICNPTFRDKLVAKLKKKIVNIVSKHAKKHNKMSYKRQCIQVIQNTSKGILNQELLKLKQKRSCF